MVPNKINNFTGTESKTKREKVIQKILVVDDEPDFVEALRRTLEANSFQVLSCSSRSQAKDMVMRTGPALIVLGTLAPAGETYALYEWLEKHPRYKEIPLMVVDARYEERQIRGLRRFEGVQMDPDDYVSKPVEPAFLLPRLRSLLEVALRKIRILVTDDHNMVRTGICAVLGLQRDLEVVGEAANGREAVDQALRLLPNVALMDIVMPIMSGIEATKLITKECPETKVLILTQYDEEENMIVAKQSGAFGFVPKKAASSELLTAIHHVALGKYYPADFAELIVR